MIGDRELAAADWHRLNRLLAEALDLEPPERTDWLATLPDDSRDLKPLLEQLLVGADSAGLEGTSQTLRPVVQLAAEAMATMRREQPGDRIGPWQLERLLAEGGMGAVWVAQRADGVMQRTAALKLPRAEWVDHGLAARIARERSVLARLQHPHIAMLYDAGLGDGGRPYLALEYVDGVAIDVWCRGRELREILRLFVQVVRAAAYAHGQLVIHRDLKPANVLVKADGTPKLLDFGISKLIEGEATAAEATALTRLAGRPMTLAYAAPEQILGLPITVAADIYALGVMLFELLTGARLYRAQAPRAMEAEILRGDLRPPGDAAADRPRARQLKGDLDAIVLTALKRQPPERYDSAAALADDLQRYLDGKPVRARPDSRTYRLKKFVARNALSVAAASAVVLALGIGLGVALWQGNEARQQAARATALNTFVLGLIRTADPNASRETKAADVAMLRAIEERVDHDFKGSPDQLLQLRVTVGDAYKNRGEMTAAQRVFQRAVDEASLRLPTDDLVLLTAQVRASDPDLIVSTAAAEQLGRAIAILRGRAGKDAGAAELLIDALLNRIAMAQYYGVPAHLTHEETTESVAELEGLASGRFGPGSRQHLRASRAAIELASLRYGSEAALKQIDTVLAPGRERGDGVTDSAEYLSLSIEHAGSRCATGNIADGLAGLWTLAEKVRASHGPTSLLLERIYEFIGGCLSDAGDATASGWIFDAYEIAASRERPPSTNLMRRANLAFNWAAGARDFKAAEHYYQKALQNSAAIPEEAIRDRLTMGLRNGRVCQLAQRGEADEAVRLAMPLLDYYNDVYAKLGRLTPAQGGIWICTADALRQLGRFDEAIRIAETFRVRCVELLRIAPSSGCAPRAAAMRAMVELDAGRVADALATIGDQLDRPPAPRDPRLPIVLGRLLLAADRAPKAVEVLRDSYGGWLSMQPDSPYAAESLYWFGRAYQAVGDKRGGRMVAQARQRLATSPVATHRRLAAGHAVP